MSDQPFVLDSFAVITDAELMQEIAQRAANGEVDAQKMQRGLARWTIRYKEGAASCICCFNPIVDDTDIGAYFICFSEHEHEDLGFASAFCFDCGNKHDDLDAFVAAGVKGLRDRGIVMIPLGIAGRG
jgi:hypothetical protein